MGRMNFQFFNFKLRKLVLIFLIILAFSFGLWAFSSPVGAAQGDLDPMPGVHVGTGEGADVPTLKYFEIIFKRVLNIATTAAGLVTFLMLVAGGFAYFTSEGDPQKTAQAKKTVTWAIAGLAVLLAAWFILLFIKQFTGIDVTIFEIPS